jgi:hypothetical protein
LLYDSENKSSLLLPWLIVGLSEVRCPSEANEILRKEQLYLAAQG